MIGEQNYSVTIAPFEFSSFKELSIKEAKEYFEWYMSVKEARINNLNSYINKNNNILLDYSLKSLEMLWKWFVKNIKTEIMTEEECYKECDGKPEWIQEKIRKKKTKISITTWCICQDIAVYFAETMIKEHEELYWSYLIKPKNVVNVNEPVIMGFSNKLYFSPFHIVANLTRKAVQDEETSLVELYLKWTKML